MQLVISRFSEDVRWAEELNIPTIIYNKGKPISSRFSVHNISNTGREAGTYLYHIIDHWDSLDEFTIFTQGYPSDHLPEGIKINHLFKDRANEMVIPSALRAIEWNENHRLDCGGNWTAIVREQGIKPSSLTMAQYFRKYLDMPLPPYGLLYTPGAIFGVSRKLIQSRPRTFYMRLLETVDHHVHPEEAHYLERAWIYVFTGEA